MESTNPLELVHTDICGPFDPISIRGNKYFISFINDFNRKLWVYLINEMALQRGKIERSLI